MVAANRDEWRSSVDALCATGRGEDRIDSCGVIAPNIGVNPATWSVAGLKNTFKNS